MTTYPVCSPVASAQLGTLIHLGPLERSFTLALDTFSNGPSGLMVPEIESRWQAIRQVPLNEKTAMGFVDAGRRLIEEGEMLAHFYRGLQESASPDTTMRFSSNLEEAESERRRVRERLKEMTVQEAARTTISPGRTPWSLVLPALRRGVTSAAFVNQDGRCIHLADPLGDSLLFGYGWVAGAMHYLEISPSAPLGRSRALFVREKAPRPETWVGWVLAMSRSLIGFYSPQLVPLAPKVRVSVWVAGDARTPKSQSGPLNVASEAEFREAEAAGVLAPGVEFTIESEETVAGRRGSTLSTINTVVPMASLRAMPDGVLVRSHYFPVRSQIPGESGIPQDVRRRLRFGATRAP